MAEALRKQGFLLSEQIGGKNGDTDVVAQISEVPSGNRFITREAAKARRIPPIFWIASPYPQ
jgi:hypothetical protein